MLLRENLSKMDSFYAITVTVKLPLENLYKAGNLKWRFVRRAEFLNKQKFCMHDEKHFSFDSQFAQSNRLTL